MINSNLKNPYDWINSVDDATKEKFELDDILYEIAIQLFEYRNSRKMNQSEMANLLGVSQAMVSKLESGEYNPSVEQLWKISKKLDFELKIIFSENKIENKVIGIWKNIASKTNICKDDEQCKLGVSA